MSIQGKKDVVGITKLAEILDISERRIQQLISEGVIHRAERGKYYLVESIRGYIGYRIQILEEQMSSIRKQADEKIKLSDLENEKLFTIKLQEEIRLLSKRSEKVDINTKQLSGELIPKYEVLRKWQQTAAIIRTGVLSIAHKVKTKHPELELIYYNTIDNESRQILEELSHDGLPNGYQRCAVRDDADVEAST